MDMSTSVEDQSGLFDSGTFVNFYYMSQARRRLRRRK